MLSKATALILGTPLLFAALSVEAPVSAAADQPFSSLIAASTARSAAEEFVEPTEAQLAYDGDVDRMVWVVSSETDRATVDARTGEILELAW